MADTLAAQGIAPDVAANVMKILLSPKSFYPTLRGKDTLCPHFLCFARLVLVAPPLRLAQPVALRHPHARNVDFERTRRWRRRHARRKRRRRADARRSVAVVERLVQTRPLVPPSPASRAAAAAGCRARRRRRGPWRRR